MADYAVVAMANPHVLRVTLSAEDGMTFDMTHISKVILGVRAPHTVTLWQTRIISQTTTELVVEHPFVDGDLKLQGEYRLLPNLETPRGVVLASIIDMWVYT
jgi:hypothetical protein